VSVMSLLLDLLFPQLQVLLLLQHLRDCPLLWHRLEPVHVRLDDHQQWPHPQLDLGLLL